MLTGFNAAVSFLNVLLTYDGTYDSLVAQKLLVTQKMAPETAKRGGKNCCGNRHKFFV